MAKLKRQIKKPTGGITKRNGPKAVGKKQLNTKGKIQKTTTGKRNPGGGGGVGNGEETNEKRNHNQERWKKKKKTEDEEDEGFDVAPSANDLSHIIPKFPGKQDGGGGEDGAKDEEDVDTRSLVHDQNKKQKRKQSGGFQSMGLSYPVYKGVMKKGYKIPTPIQRKTIPVIMDGKDWNG